MGEAPPPRWGLPRGCDPGGLLARGLRKPPRGAEQGAVAEAPPRRTRSRARQGAARGPGQSAGAVELAYTCLTRLRTRPLRLPILQVRGAPGNRCAPQGRGRSGRRGCQSPGFGPCSRAQSLKDPGPRCARRLSGRREGAGHQRIFVFPFFPPHALARGHFPTRGSRARGCRRRRARPGRAGRGRGAVAAGWCGERPAAAPRAPGRGGPACRTPRPGRARRYSASRAH